MSAEHVHRVDISPTIGPFYARFWTYLPVWSSLRFSESADFTVLSRTYRSLLADRERHPHTSGGARLGSYGGTIAGERNPQQGATSEIDISE